MAVTLVSTGGLFTRLGKAIELLDDINTARGTTVPGDIEDVLTELNAGTPSLEIQALANLITPVETNVNSGSSSSVNAIKTYCTRLLIQMVNEDNPQPSNDLTTALIELIRQMTATADDVDASTVSATITAGSGNVGDGVLVASTKRPDGRVCETLFAEDIIGKVTGGAAGREVISFKGEAAIADKLSAAWPQGSACSAIVTATDADSTGGNLLTNGSFEDEDDLADAPDDWSFPVATISTTLGLTNVEVQTVAISGTPTAGTYRLHYTNASSLLQTTSPLPYNATASQVQSALRALTGLARVSVATTAGTTPNFTHTITFNGVGGNVTQLTSTNNLDTGSIAHATTVTGSTHVFGDGKALAITGNGSQLTCLQQRINPAALSQYAFNCWMKADVVPAAGVIRISLWDGNAVINDEQGVANSFTQTCSALTTGYVSKTGVFRTPKNLPAVVYLRIELTTAVSSGTIIYIDHAALAPMVAMYAGGPEIAAFSGSVDFKPGNDQVLPDLWTVAMANNYTGEFQQAFERLFDMRAKGLILPSDTGGTETIDDSLIG